MEKTDKNPKGAGRKTNVASYEDRIPEAMEMILYKKLSYNEFRTEGAKKWGISERHSENIWKDCKERLLKRFEEKSEEIISEQLSRYFDLLDRARADNNKRVERETLADINKLYGLEQRKIDVTTNGQPITISIQLDQ
jgi:hypothetical protein